MVKKISDPPYLSVIKSYDPSFLRMGLQQGLNSYSPLFFNMRNVVGHMHAGYVCCQLYLGMTTFLGKILRKLSLEIYFAVKISIGVKF